MFGWFKKKTPKPASNVETLSRERDELLFSLYGRPRGEGLITRLDSREVDQSSLTDGVFVFDPGAERATVACVTSGLATPWEVDDEGIPPNASEVPSGLGFELAMEVAPDQPIDWPVNVLFGLMRYQRRATRLLHRGEFVPLKPAGLPSEGSIEALLLIEARGGDRLHQLRAGCFRVVQAVGITAKEAGWAFRHGTGDLTQRIVERFGFETRCSRPTHPEMDHVELPPELRPHFA